MKKMEQEMKKMEQEKKKASCEVHMVLMLNAMIILLADGN